MKDEYKEMVCRVRFIDGVPAETYLSDIEIVRCKECKHYHPNAKNTVMNCRNSHGLLHATEDDYCSKAERKQNGI